MQIGVRQQGVERTIFRLFVYILIGMILGCKKEPLNTALISGRVTFDGSNVASATVNLESRNVSTTTTTDAFGKYAFDQLALGDYTLIAGFTTSVTMGGSVTAQINKEGEHLIVDIPTSIVPAGGGSCPYIYAFDGSSYVFNGDIYAGAVLPQLERDDYTRLVGLKNCEGAYRLRITNELQEKQFTNLAELMVVSHPKEVQILFDKYGHLQTLSQSQAPRSATSAKGVDYSLFLQKADEISYMFNELPHQELSWTERITDIFYPQSGKNSLVLTFDRSQQVEKAKLVVKAKNSNWLISLYHELNGFFGTYYEDWQKEQRQRPASDLLQERLEEGVPLMVYAQNGTTWEYVDCFNLVGSVISRDMVMALDLSKIRGDTVKLKLECGFMFWELDYAAIDYSENVSCAIERFDPSPTNNQNLYYKVRADDSSYLEHLNFGDRDELVYQTNIKEPDASHTFFLHSKGYYEEKVNNQNTPNFFRLIGFMRPGAFAQYSVEHYLERFQNNAVAVR